MVRKTQEGGNPLGQYLHRVLPHIEDQPLVPSDVLDVRSFSHQQFTAFPVWLNTGLKEWDWNKLSLETHNLGDGRILAGVGFDEEVSADGTILSGVFAALNPGIGYVSFLGDDEVAGISLPTADGEKFLYVRGPSVPFSDQRRNFGALTCKVKTLRDSLVAAHALTMAQSRLRR